MSDQSPTLEPIEIFYNLVQDQRGGGATVTAGPMMFEKICMLATNRPAMYHLNPTAAEEIAKEAHWYREFYLACRGQAQAMNQKAKPSEVQHWSDRVSTAERAIIRMRTIIHISDIKTE